MSNPLTNSNLNISPPTPTRRLLVLFTLILVLLLGTWLRLETYDRYLPFQDRTDESVYQVTSLHRRGVERNGYVEEYYASQPPGYIWLTMVMQPFTEAGRPWTLLADYLHAQRLLAVLVGVLTTAIVMRLGWQMGGTIAAFFAGLVWAVSPHIVDVNSQSLPDPFVYLTVAASLTMAFQALRRASGWWLFGSLVMGIVAIYFKYTPVYALIPWGIIALVLLLRQPRQTIYWLIPQGLLAAACAWYLLVNYAALDLPNREVATFREEGLVMAFDRWRIFNNWWSSTRPIGEWLFIVTLLTGSAAWFYSRSRSWRRIEWRRHSLLVLYIVVGVLMASSFTNVWEGHISHKIRHVLPITVAVLGIWGGAVAQTVWTSQRLWNSRDHAPRWLPATIPVLLTLLILLPALRINLDLIEQYQRADTRQTLWEWTDDNIPPDGRIMTRDGDMLGRNWNRWWGGYDGKTPFDWWHENPVPQNTPGEYMERGIAYFAISDHDLQAGFEGRNKAVRPFVEQLIHLKTIRPDSPNLTGATLHFYRMLPPQNEISILFDGRIELCGYDLNTSEFGPGGRLVFRPYWRIRDYPRTNYSLFVHLYPEASDTLVTQYDGPPSHLNRPTLTWDDLDELYIGSDAVLNLPDDFVPGAYRLVVGLYDYLTGERLFIETGEDHYSIPVIAKEQVMAS